MGHLEDIPVFSSLDLNHEDRSMVDAVIIELLQLVDSYLLTQAAGAVDIKSLPLSGDAYQLLKSKLGLGEVNAVVSLSGDTEVYETLFSGVWWIIHKDTDNRVIAEHIEVGRVPAILCSHNEDIRQAREKLHRLVSN
ncbi:MAG: hydrogenase expression/formation protein [Gammaproteobacteria bacterium]|nr:hydrogenase expression/formation protein [Gammaproteobacteria bacterium]